MSGVQDYDSDCVDFCFVYPLTDEKILQRLPVCMSSPKAVHNVMYNRSFTNREVKLDAHLLFF
jgi:hypothetical protein